MPAFSAASYKIKIWSVGFMGNKWLLSPNTCSMHCIPGSVSVLPLLCANCTFFPTRKYFWCARLVMMTMLHTSISSIFLLSWSCWWYWDHIRRWWPKASKTSVVYHQEIINENRTHWTQKVQFLSDIISGFPNFFTDFMILKIHFGSRIFAMKVERICSVIRKLICWPAAKVAGVNITQWEVWLFYLLQYTVSYMVRYVVFSYIRHTQKAN